MGGRPRFIAVVVLAVLAVGGTALGQADPAPTANFTFAPASPQRNQVITFDGSSTTDNGTIVQYRWDFNGDGRYEVNSGANPRPTHTYPNAGTTVVGLQVTDNAANTDTTTKSVTVRDAAPVAVAKASPDPAQPGETVTFDGGGSTDDSAIASYAWDLDGDGSFETAGATPSRSYPTGGTRAVKLRVLDDAGQSGETTLSVRIGSAPTAQFTVPRDLRPGVIGSFDASVSAGEGRHFSWTFGGVPIDAGAQPVTAHGFTLPGNYRVVLTVTDAFGRTATSQQDVHVATEPQSSLSVRPAFPRPRKPVTFTAATKTDAGSPIDFYAWDFGDGKPGRESRGGLRFPGLHPTGKPTATHTFAKAGVYTVVMKAVGTDGQVVQTTHRLRVGNAPGAKGAAHAAATPPQGSARKVVQSAIKTMAKSSASEDAVAPTMTSSALPHTEDPVAVTLAMADLCATVPYAGGGPLDDFEAKINGDWVTNPAESLDLASKGTGYTPADKQYGGVAIGGGRRAHTAATSTTECFPLGTIRVLSMNWGDGTIETPPEAEPDASKSTQKKTLSHVYKQAGKRTLTATVEVIVFGDGKNDAKKAKVTVKVSETIDVVQSYCGVLLVRGLAATVAGSETGCWVPSALGFVATSGEVSIGGVTLRSSDPKNGILAVQGNKPNTPEQPGNGTITAGPAKVEVEVGGQKVSTVDQLVIPAGNPHVILDVINAPFAVDHLSVAGGNLTLRNDGAPSLALNLRLPPEFNAGNGQASTVSTGDVAGDQVKNPATPIPAKGPPELPFGSISIPGLSLTHDAKGWHGGAQLELGFAKIDAPDEFGVSGIGLKNDGQAYLGASLAFAVKPNFLEVLALDSVSIFGTIKPTSLTGTVTMSIVDGNLFKVNGSLGMVWPEGSGTTVQKFCDTTFVDTKVNGQPKPWTMRLCGDATLLDLLPLGNAHLQVDGNGHVEVGGGVNYAIGGDWITADVTLAGAYDDPNHWQVGAHGHICEHIIDDECVSGDLWVTPLGAAACIDLWIADVGAYVRWKPFDWDYFLHSCGSRAPKHIGAAARMARVPGFAAALPSAKVKTAAGEAWHMIVVRGPRGGAPPSVKVTGPGGRTFTDSGAKKQCLTLKGAGRGCSGVGTRHNGIVRSTKTNTTVVYIADPGKGTWTVTPLDGSAPITAIDHAEGLEDPEITGAVSGDPKAGYALGLKNVAQPGMAVNLVEQGAGKAAQLRTRGAKSSSIVVPVAHAARQFHDVKFTPAPGLGTKRKIVAEISVDGIPWKNVPVASYTAPKDVVPKAPSKLEVKPVAGGLSVSLAPGRAAAKTLVVATTGSGRTFTAVLGGAKKSVVLNGYRATEGVQVTASTIRADGVRLPNGPTTSLKPKAEKPALIGTL